MVEYMAMTTTNDAAEMFEVERSISAIISRSSKESARSLTQFFLKCLEQLNYTEIEPAERELRALEPAIDQLLMMHGMQDGFFRLAVGKAAVTVRPSYMSTDEDLSVPSLGLAGTLPPDARPTLTIAWLPQPGLDESIIAGLDDGQVLQIDAVDARKFPDRSETSIHREEQREGDQEETVSQVLQPLRRVLDDLGLDATPLERNEPEIAESWRLWIAEEALAALTITIGHIRIIVAGPEPDLALGTEVVNEIHFEMEQTEANRWSPGVLLRPPYRSRDGWERDEQTHRNFFAGNSTQSETENADAWVLRPL